MRQITIAGVRLRSLEDLGWCGFWAGEDGYIYSNHPGRCWKRLKPVHGKRYNVYCTTLYSEHILYDRVYPNGRVVRTKRPTPKPNYILVAKVWLKKPKRKGDWTIDHINGDRSDSRVCNLRYLLRGDNIREWFRRSPEHKRLIASPGSKNPMAKLREADVLEILELIKLKVRRAKIAKAYGVRPCTIDYIKKGKTWRTVPR